MRGSPPLAILDVAIVSAVGKLAETTYAALRAGIARIDEHPLFVDASGEPVCCAGMQLQSEGELDPDPSRRLQQATVSAICRLLARWSTPRLEVLLIAGDTRRPVTWPLEEAAITALPTGCLSGLTVLTEGNAGGLLALEHLSMQAEQHGHVWGLVLGADSLLDLPTLRDLERSNRLKRANRPRGLCPGEGVAALLVCDLRTATRNAFNALATVSGLSNVRESTTIFDDGPLLATALTTCLRDVVKSRALPSRLDVYCDVNGEPYRTHEWTLAALRTLDVHCELHHPADCIGDVGAASAPMLTALAALSLPARLGWPARELALVSCSSDGGLRGAALIEHPSLAGLRPRIWK